MNSAPLSNGNQRPRGDKAVLGSSVSHQTKIPPRRIALFAPNYGDYIHRLVDGVLEYQVEHGGFLLRDFRFDLGELDDPERRNDPPPWAHQADGVIAYVGPQQGLDEWLRRGRIPIVNTSADRVGSGLAAIHSDAGSIARIAVDHFEELGITEFAHVGHTDSAGSTYREQAFSAELRGRGHWLRAWRLRTPLDGIVTDIDGLLTHDPELADLLREAPKPLGVLALNDTYASVVLGVCQKIGLEVPQQVAILGAGDTSVARECNPLLSSIRVPVETIGYQAMGLLDRLIRGDRTVPVDNTVPAIDLVARGSTLERPRRDRDIDRALHMIRENACVGLTVGDVLHTLRISRKTFERKFIDVIGHPPGEEIRRVRIERAKELLLTTRLSVTRIGRMVGFERGSMFTRFFKTQTGVTPRDYRRLTESGV